MCRTGGGGWLALPEVGAQGHRGQECLKGSRSGARRLPAAATRAAAADPDALGHTRPHGVGQGEAQPSGQGSAAAAPSRRPGSVRLRVAAALPNAALRAPPRPRPALSPPAPAPRPPLAGDPSAWPDTRQLTGAALGPRRGGGGGRTAGACRGPASPGGCRSCRRLAAPRGEERPGRRAAEGPGTWAPLCVAAPGAERGAGRCRLLPPPRWPPRVRTFPGARANPSGRRCPAAAPRGRSAAWSAGTRGRALPRARVGGRGARGARPAPGASGLGSVVAQEGKLNSCFPWRTQPQGRCQSSKWSSSKWGFCLPFTVRSEKNL